MLSHEHSPPSAAMAASLIHLKAIEVRVVALLVGQVRRRDDVDGILAAVRAKSAGIERHLPKDAPRFSEECKNFQESQE